MARNSTTTRRIFGGKEPQATFAEVGSAAYARPLGNPNDQAVAETLAVGAAAAVVAVLLVALVTPGRAQEKPDAADSAKVLSCVKSAGAAARDRERCIGVVADPCAERDDAQSTADQVACAARELADGIGANPGDRRRPLRVLARRPRGRLQGRYRPIPPTPTPSRSR